MYGEIISIILENYADDVFTYEKTNELLTAACEKYIGDYYILEGANKDYRKAFKESSKRYKESLRKLKVLFRKIDPDSQKEFYKELENANKALDDGISEISDIPSSLVSTILSFIIVEITQWARWILPTIATLGLAIIGEKIESTIIFLKGIIKGIKNEEDWVDALNMVRQKYLYLCDCNRHALKILEKKYQKQVSKRMS